MRKSFIICLTLLVLCLGGFIFVSDSIEAPEEDVVLIETTYYGDVAAAEGLNVDLESHLKYHLFWVTEYEPGRHPEIDTDFEFIQGNWKGDHSYIYDYSGISLDMANNFGYSTSGSINLDEWEFETVYKYLVPILKDITSKTPNDGQLHFQTVNLQDYYEYYPFSFHIDLPAVYMRHLDDHRNEYYIGEPVISGEAAEKFLEFFKIPILEGEEMEIGIAKNENGDIFELNVSATSESYYFQPYSVVLDNGCYFTFSIDKSSSEHYKELDLSLIPGGYGIYHVGYKTQGEYQLLDTNSLEMVFPLREDEQIQYFSLNADGKYMILVTQNEREFYLTVLTADTAEEVQRVLITKQEENEYNNYWLDVYDNDGYIVFRSTDRTILFEEQTDGSYECKIDVESRFDELDAKFDVRTYAYGERFAWNGERLAIASFTRHECAFAEYPYTGSTGNYLIESCGFDLYVYDAEDLQYCGNFASSLDVVSDKWSKNCEPLSSYSYSGLDISWKD